MSWILVGDWAEMMSYKLQDQHRQRLNLAAKHFGLDIFDVLGDDELEERLLARYEATGLPWPPVKDEDED